MFVPEMQLLGSLSDDESTDLHALSESLSALSRSQRSIMKKKKVRKAPFNLMRCIFMNVARATCQYDDGI
jgi:hypothetical protein